jgi:hypothetical protein
MTRPTMTGAMASPVLRGRRFLAIDRWPVITFEAVVARFDSLPFRHLAGPAGVFFLWPPKSRARTGTSPGGQP